MKSMTPAQQAAAVRKVLNRRALRKFGGARAAARLAKAGKVKK